MGDWSDYFEDFPEENPANQYRDSSGSALERRVKRAANYSSKAIAESAEVRRRRGTDLLNFSEKRRRLREQAQAELHRSIGGLIEAYSWFDVHLGLKIRAHSNSAPEVMSRPCKTPNTRIKPHNFL